MVQAVLDAPLFGVRWRWNLTTSLGLPRYAGGRKVPPQLLRMKSEDLLASVFPDQVACLENIVGEREVPDHPLVAQTLDDCLHEAMDCEGWLALLRDMESGAVDLLARDLPAPSALAAEILTARPYAYLDDAPLEERRTQAVQNRRWSDPESADDLGALDLEAIEAVRGEAWPEARNADEMHEALNSLGFLTSGEAEANPGWGMACATVGATPRRTPGLRRQHSLAGGGRLPAMRLVHPAAKVPDAFQAPRGYPPPDSAEAATVELTRARLGGFGPRTAGQLAADLGIGLADQQYALAALEREGYVLRGRFSPGATEEEWCERHLLARIHRYTVKRLRREIEPVQRADFMRFLFDWQRLAPGTRGRGAESLATVVEQAGRLPGRGGRLGKRTAGSAGGRLRQPLAGPAVSFRTHRLGAPGRTQQGRRRSAAQRADRAPAAPRTGALERPAARRAGAGTVAARGRVLEVLREQGASFFDELSQDAHLLRSELENALGEWSRSAGSTPTASPGCAPC